MGVHRISTKKVLTEKYQMSSNFCRNKTSIQRSSLFKGQFLIHDPILMCFCLFTPEYWTVDTDLGKQKEKKKTTSLDKYSGDKSPSLFIEFLNSLNYLNTFY